jgi:hypothetical protein
MNKETTDQDQPFHPFSFAFSGFSRCLVGLLPFATLRLLHCSTVASTFPIPFLFSFSCLGAFCLAAFTLLTAYTILWV